MRSSIPDPKAMTGIDLGNETENSIFAAALEVFSRKGKDGARMQEIADAAGINKAMLHYYFRSKDLLYESVFEHVARHFFSALDEIMTRPGPFLDALADMIDVYMDMHAANPAVARLWIQENLNGAPVAGRILVQRKETGASGPHMLLKRVRQAVEDGEIRPTEPIQLMITLLGMTVMSFISQPTMTALDPAAMADQRAFLKRRKQHIVEVLTHGLAS